MGSICCCGGQQDEEEYNRFNTNINKNNSKESEIKSGLNETHINSENTNIIERPISESNNTVENNVIKSYDKSNIISSQPKTTDQSQYKTASREEMAAAAERRLAENKSRGSKGVVKLKAANADLPEAPKGGLRWQMG